MNLFSGIGLRSVASNTLSQFSVRLITSLTTLLVSFLISFHLGFGTYGSFTKVVAFVTFFYLFIDFGLNAFFLKDYYENVREKFVYLFVLRLLLSIAVIFLIWLVSFLLPFSSINGIGFSQQEKLGIFLYSLTLMTFGATLSLQSLLQRFLTYQKLVIPTLLSSLILIFGVLFGVFQNNLHTIFISYLVSGFVLVASLWFVSKEKMILVFSFAEFKQISSKILVQSAPLALVLILNLVYAKVDIFILSLSKPTFDVGVYGFSYRIFELAIAIPALTVSSIYPYLIESQKEKTLFINLIKKYSLILFLTSLVLGGVLFLLSPLLQLVKSDFSYSVVPLKILLVSLPFFFITSLLQWVLIIKGHMKPLILIYFVSMVVTIFGNLIFIPLYSYYASAVITGASEALVLLLMLGYFMISKEKIFRNYT